VTFGDWQSALRYYEAEGFLLSHTRCQHCGHEQVTAHFPVADAATRVLASCIVCGNQSRMPIVRRINYSEYGEPH
jgi:transcription elongation factor Elf1